MTIDEAIEHAEERAYGNNQYSKDHAQLANWLRELRLARMEIDMLRTLRDGFKADAQKYKAENAKLRDIAHDMWRLLLATGNDDLVLSIEVGGVVKEVIDADELAKTMCELGIELDEWQ